MVVHPPSGQVSISCAEGEGQSSILCSPTITNYDSQTF